MDFNLTDKALQDLGNLFVKMLKEKIASRQYPYGNPEAKGVGNKIASGFLYDSLKATIVPSSKDEPATLQITYADYFKYVNRGRRMGVKRVPIDNLLEWIKIKKLKGRDKKGRFIKNISFAFAIQTNIFKYGIRPTGLYDKALDSIEELFDNPPEEIQEEIEKLYVAIEGDINNFIEKTIEIEISKT